LIDFTVESEGDAIDVDDDDPDQSNDEDKVDEEAELGDDFKALDKSKNGGNNSRMETDPSIPESQGGKNVSRSVAHQVLESSIKDRVFGIDQHIPAASALVLRDAEDNIGKILLQKFDAKGEEEDEVGKKRLDAALTDKPDLPMPSLVWKEKKQWGPVQATRMRSRIPRWQDCY
jgi:hypothetical protein